ncbi:MAG: hypothetical protein AAB531_00525 [Patescibacteria group bacterium]
MIFNLKCGTSSYIDGNTYQWWIHSGNILNKSVSVNGDIKVSI